MRNFKSAVLAGAAVSGFILFMAGQAGATILTYAGSDFTSVQDSDFGSSLDAVVVTNTPLPANFSGTLTASDISSLTLTDVGGTLAPINASTSVTSGERILLTNGVVTNWVIGLVNGEAGGILMFTSDSNSLYPGVIYVGDFVNSYDNSFAAINSNIFTPGVWTVSETAGVPEPAAWALMLLGMGSLGVALRQSRRLAVAAKV